MSEPINDLWLGLAAAFGPVLKQAFPDYSAIERMHAATALAEEVRKRENWFQPPAALAAMQQAPVANDVRELVSFLNEAACYFEKRPINGEDAAHWANVMNAKNCRRAAAMLTRLTQPQADAAVAVEQIVQDVCDLVPDYAEGDPAVVEISTGDLAVILERHLAAIRAGGQS